MNNDQGDARSMKNFWNILAGIDGGRILDLACGRGQFIEVLIDNELAEKISLPTDFTKRRHEICWKYNLKPEKHTVKIKLVNPANGFHILMGNILIYDDKPGIDH